MNGLALGRALRKIRRRLRPPEHIGACRFRDARDRGGAYLLRRQHTDGGIAAHPKALVAFDVCGYSRAADRVCTWIRGHCMEPNRPFRPRPTGDPSHNQIYAASWIALGAHRLGQFDISRSSMDSIMNCRVPHSGGFTNEQTAQPEDARQELIYVGFCGLAALHTGRLDVARAAGGWLRTVFEAQPNFPEELYTIYSTAQGLHTDPPANDAIRYVVSSQAEDDQFFFQAGVAGGFLARLFQATGDEAWLTLAMEYMHFAEVANDHLFRLLRAGKVGWAAAILYTITGAAKYRDMALRVGEHLIASQSRLGYWHALHRGKPSVGMTAEMVVWLDEIYQAVDSG